MILVNFNISNVKLSRSALKLFACYTNEKSSLFYRRMLSFLFFMFASFFAIIAFVNIAFSWWLRSFFKTQARKASAGFQGAKGFSRSQNDSDKTNHSTTSQPGKLVQCAYCKTYIPLESSFKSGLDHFCHREHYELYQQ